MGQGALSKPVVQWWLSLNSSNPSPSYLAIGRDTPGPNSRYLSKWRPATSVRGQLSARRSTRRARFHLLGGASSAGGTREREYNPREAHEPFDPFISVHAAWDVGGGGACTKRTRSNSSRFISHPGENVKTVSAPGNNFL